MALRARWPATSRRATFSPRSVSWSRPGAIPCARSARSLGVEDISLEDFGRVPGRFEPVDEGQDFGVLVDYAHTPDSLDNVLRAARELTSGRLHVVFGAGGDRDASKRPLMGRAAAQLADVAIVTDDNPRSEEPARIRAAVMAGCPGAREIGDRAEAIAGAIAGLRAGDVLVVAGKGHETGQIVGDRVLPFDDAEEVRRALALSGGEPATEVAP